MIIIFYDPEKEELHVCSHKEKMKIVPVDHPDLMSQIPNDDILYVQNAHFITKRQLNDWIHGTGVSEKDDPTRFSGLLDESPVYTPDVEKMIDKTSNTSGKWIHPAHHGAIMLSDVKTPKFPQGAELIGKYHFVSVDDLGGFEELEESSSFNWLLAKGKIEVVDYEYVKKHYGKKKQTSLADIALDAILIKHGSAESVAASGGIHGGNVTTLDSGAIEFLVE